MTVFLPHSGFGAPCRLGREGESTSIKFDFSRSWGVRGFDMHFFSLSAVSFSQFLAPSGYQWALRQDLWMPPSAPRIRWPAPGSYP
jgi:hypothetical protein